MSRGLPEEAPWLMITISDAINLFRRFMCISNIWSWSLVTLAKRKNDFTIQIQLLWESLSHCGNFSSEIPVSILKLRKWCGRRKEGKGFTLRREVDGGKGFTPLQAVQRKCLKTTIRSYDINKKKEKCENCMNVLSFYSFFGKNLMTRQNLIVSGK